MEIIKHSFEIPDREIGKVSILNFPSFMMSKLKIKNEKASSFCSFSWKDFMKRFNMHFIISNTWSKIKDSTIKKQNWYITAKYRESSVAFKSSGIQFNSKSFNSWTYLNWFLHHTNLLYISKTVRQWDWCCVW